MVATAEMEQHLTPILRKRKSKFLCQLQKKGKQKN